MSSAKASQQGGWVRTSYDKLIVLIVLIGLMGSALFLVVRVQRGSRIVADTSVGVDSVAQKSVEPLNTDLFNEALSRLKNPPTMTVHSNQLMVSETRVWCTNPEGRHAPIPYDRPICPYCQYAQPPITDFDERDNDGDGMPNGYETEHGFDLRNPADAGFDSDGDGFTNIEEYEAETDPRNQEDYPDLPAKLRLAGVRRIPFVLRFQGVSDIGGAKKFLLNLKSLDRSYFASLGDTVEGFTLISYDPLGPEGPALLLERRGEQTKLVKGVQQDRYEVMAGLVFLLDRKTYKVRVGDTFDLRGKAYKVVDIKKNVVSIRGDLGPIYRVQPLTSLERSELTDKPHNTGSNGRSTGRSFEPGLSGPEPILTLR